MEISLGLRPEKRIGTDEQWDQGERALATALEKAKRPHVVTPGDGAFYGPKIDFRVKDAIGRPWQLGTIQCDFEHAESFDLNYIGEDGREHRPVIMHRAILGSFERFIGILIEHTGGNFPFWIAPVQAAVLPVSDRFAEKARETGARLSAAGTARRGRRQEREARRPHPPGRADEGPVHAGRGREGGGQRVRSPSACATEATPVRCPSRNFISAAQSAVASRQSEFLSEVKDR